MNTTLKIVLIVTAVLFAAVALIAGGILVGRNLNARVAFFQHPLAFQQQPGSAFGGCQFGSFLGLTGKGTLRNPGTFGRFAPMQRGMMGRPFAYPSQAAPAPLSMEEARQIFEDYVIQTGIDDLALHEVMLFELNGYAIVTERSSGMGALELLLDYGTRSVFPEYGPARMWNMKYGMMGAGRGRGMMGWASPSYNASVDADFNMPVSAEEASELAQAYLDQNLTGADIAAEGAIFYGYYSFDYIQDGTPAGMVSVNGFSGQVWPHTWHGAFLEEWEAE